jgi:hypothetical protein
MKHRTPFATVHLPVLEGKAKALYVARRSAVEWFVGGEGFTDDDGQFRRVDMAQLVELLGADGDVLDLDVGEHVFRHEDEEAWTRGRIPVGRTFLVTYDVRPTRAAIGPPGIGGAFAGCWVVCRSISAAKRASTAHLESDGWAIVGTIGATEKVAGDLAEGTAVYFRQAQIDGFVCVLHTFPADDTDAN